MGSGTGLWIPLFQGLEGAGLVPQQLAGCAGRTWRPGWRRAGRAFVRAGKGQTPGALWQGDRFPAQVTVAAGVGPSSQGCRGGRSGCPGARDSCWYQARISKLRRGTCRERTLLRPL